MMQMLVIRLHRPFWLAVTSLIARSTQRGWKNGKGNVSLCLYFVEAPFLVVFQRDLTGFLGPWQNTISGRSLFLPLFLVLPPIYISKHSNSWITIKNWKLRWQRKIISLIKRIQFRVQGPVKLNTKMCIDATTNRSYSQPRLSFVDTDAILHNLLKVLMLRIYDADLYFTYLL